MNIREATLIELTVLKGMSSVSKNRAAAGGTAALEGSGFTSPQAVRERIDALVGTNNQAAKPFRRTKT